MTRTLIAGAAALAIASLVPISPASATASTGTSGQSDVTVSGGISQVRTPLAYGNGATEKLTDHELVKTDDLDLQHKADRAILASRVRDAAYAACERLDYGSELAGVIAETRLQCADQAIADAQPQVRKAISAAA